jgi:hypothetical protein
MGFRVSVRPQAPVFHQCVGGAVAAQPLSVQWNHAPAQFPSRHRRSSLNESVLGELPKNVLMTVIFGSIVVAGNHRVRD